MVRKVVKSVEVPEDIELPCGTDISDTDNTNGVPHVTDNCTPDQEIMISFSDSPETATCGEIIRTWHAVDACGNEQFFYQKITLIDDAPPEIHCPDEAHVACSESSDPSEIGFPTVSDNCTATEDIVLTYEDDDLWIGV